MLTKAEFSPHIAPRPADVFHHHSINFFRSMRSISRAAAHVAPELVAELLELVIAIDRQPYKRLPPGIGLEREAL